VGVRKTESTEEPLPKDSVQDSATSVPLFDGHPRMRAIKSIVESVADTDTTVLIRGESGVGKELIARAVHTASGKRVGAFVKVNCAAIPRDLLESELFGHEKGAFTGAHRRKLGQSEYANRGTLFLDEIGELPLAL
jgi:transcriptional regulator with GAF, ATPase, and Fis domain